MPTRIPAAVLIASALAAWSAPAAAQETSPPPAEAPPAAPAQPAPAWPYPYPPPSYPYPYPPQGYPQQPAVVAPTPVPAAPVQAGERKAPACRVVRIGTPKEIEKILGDLYEEGYNDFFVVGNGVVCGWQ